MQAKNYPTVNMLFPEIDAVLLAAFTLMGH
jgi:hypothetical protein